MGCLLNPKVGLGGIFEGFVSPPFFGVETSGSASESEGNVDRVLTSSCPSCDVFLQRFTQSKSSVLSGVLNRKESESAERTFCTCGPYSVIMTML